MQNKSTVTLPQTACVNCHLSTRSDQSMCLHGNHHHAIKMPLGKTADRQPTSEDREFYSMWLSQQADRGEVIH